MNSLDSRVRTWIIWALPFLVIALLIGWETEWGERLTRVPALDAAVTPQPVNVALMPEYKVDGGVEGNRETVERTLFNPTRRPAPPSIATAARQTMPKGKFLLTGTLVVDKKATAFLKEVNGGRSRRVQQGEMIDGMLVAEVRADRVKLTLNDETEEIVLKVAAGPKSTVQPVPAPNVPGQPGQPGGPVAGAAPQQVPQPGSAGAQAPAQDVADVLANRRRAARAAEAQNQNSNQTPAAPQAAPATRATPAAPDPAWNEVYQRYMQPRK